ncbi:3488_t:CDS:2, partial [Entrophospora sp. SA101]
PTTLYSTQEPITDLWQLRTASSRKRLDARPISNNALERIQEKRKRYGFFTEKNIEEEEGRRFMNMNDAQAIDIKVDEHSQEINQCVNLLITSLLTQPFRNCSVND